MRNLAYKTFSLYLFCAPVWAAEQTQKAVAQVSGDAAGHLIQVTLGLVAVLGLIFGAAWFVKRYSVLPGAAGSAMRVVSVLPMGQREKLVLVQLGEQQLLLGVAPGRISTLHVLEEPLEALKADSVAAGSFSERFRAALKERMTS